MKPRDKISKSSWNLAESIKDVVTANIVAAMRGGQLKIDAKTLNVLLQMLPQFVDAGFHRGHKVFMREIDVALAMMPKPVVQVAKKN